MMEVRNVDISLLKPYEKNAKEHPQEQIDQIAKCIEKYGWVQPLVIDQNGVIVIGHGRYYAGRQLGLTEVPCIVKDDCTDTELRELRIADNKLNESEWDLDVLQEELFDLDFSDLGIEFDFPEEAEDDTEEDGDHIPYVATRDYDNLQKAIYAGEGQFDIPILRPQLCSCTDWIGFNFAMSCKDPWYKGIHFFVDDYQFARLWERPEQYIPLLEKFKALMSPDFSMYTDFPRAIQIYAHYKKHWLGAFWQEHGFTVIPTISWSDEESFNYCFDGEPKGACIALSTVGTQKSRRGRELFKQGYEETLKRLEPKQIIVNGRLDESLKVDGIEYIEIEAFQNKWNDA